MSTVENILFLMDNAADRGTVTASSAVASMPATNLQDYQRTRVWRSSGGSPQTIDVILAESETSQIGAVAVVDHNLSPGGAIRLQGWPDGVDVGPAEVDVTVEPWEPFYGYGAGEYGVGGYGGTAEAAVRTLLRPISFVPLPDFSDLRYWRLTLTDASLAYIQVGRLYLGGIWQPETNIAWGWRLQRQGRTRTVESRGGQAYGNPRPGRAAIEGNLEWLSWPDRDALYLRYLQVEDHTPFIVCVRPVGGIVQATTALYVRFEAFEFSENFYQNAQAPLRLVEDL